MVRFIKAAGNPATVVMLVSLFGNIIDQKITGQLDPDYMRIL